MDYQRAGVAETYRRARSLPAPTMALWRDLLRELGPAGGASTVIDVGCGTGRFSGCLAESFGATVIGVDASTRMLEAAELAAAVRYVAGVAEALPLAAGRVDVAFLSMMWHHVADPGAAVAELARVLRPGGVVVIRTPTLEILDDFPFLAFFPESRALDERRLPSRSALRIRFVDGGFAAVGHRTVQQRMSEGPGEYAARVRARAFSSLQPLSEESFARGLARFEAWVASVPVDQPLHEPVDVFVFRR